MSEGGQSGDGGLHIMRCRRVATVVEILGWAMATIQENSDEHGPVRDFAWHCTHRARRGGQLIDIVMLVGWVVVVGWVVLNH